MCYLNLVLVGGFYKIVKVFNKLNVYCKEQTRLSQIPCEAIIATQENIDFKMLI